MTHRSQPQGRPDGPVESVVATYSGPATERAREAILTLVHRQGGGADRARELVELARTDYRDVLVQLEPQRPPIDVERLLERLGRREVATDRRATDGSTTPARTSLVLVEVGARTPELMKAVRRATGLGLADVDRMLDRLPVTITHALDEQSVRQLAADLAEHGATVRVG